MTSPTKRSRRLKQLERLAVSATPRLSIVAAAVMLCGSGLAQAQQTISSSTTSTVTATGGDIVVNAGVTVGSGSGVVTPIVVDGVDVGNLTNHGNLLSSTSGGTGLYFNSTASLANIVNNGQLTSKGGIQLRSAASIVNNGAILGTDRGITVYATATGSSITNNAYLNAFTQSFSAIANQAGSTLVSVTNGASGLISGLYAVENHGVITTLTNHGSMWSRHWVPLAAIGGGGSITTLINHGSISGAGSAAAIDHTVVNLVNAQGGGSPLSITIQPTNYSIVIQSPTAYGKLSVRSANGAMNFGIHTGSSVTSGYYYGAVLSGVTGSYLANTSGTYGSTAWNLSLASGSDNIWNLCFGGGACSYTLSSDILPGQTYPSSGLGTSVNSSFDGGTLEMSSASTVTQNFTISANDGTIDQQALDSTFTGNFSDASVGAAGKLIISNSGTARQGSITLSGINTHTGGIEVQAGAMLVISAPSALGTGTLALVGSATVPAALGTTQTMTITNAITVAGDPVFNVAPGTTLTVSSPIADGATPGDIEIAGGGTLLLTAANTYTGPTLIDVGSTLALAGAGSITPTSAVSNNGTFNVSAASQTVSLGGSLVQSATGNLVVRAEPTSFQRIDVASTATLAGTLTLNATAGTYRMGRYTLLTANGVGGRFTTLSTNLGSVTPLGYFLSYGANDVYLTLAPSAAHTLQDIQDNARQMATLYSLQGAALQAGLSYDCSSYDRHGICVGLGGRRSQTNGSQGRHVQAAQVVVAYRAAPGLQVGAFADWSVSAKLSDQIRLRGTRPMVGLFGQWNHNADSSGWAVRASAAFSDNALAIDRSGGDFSEAGQGRTRVNAQAYQLMASYTHALADRVTAAPYLGVRHSRIHTRGYTEAASNDVASPLSFDAQRQRAVVALVGVGVRAQMAEQLTGNVTVGVQHDLSRSMGHYAGSSEIPGLSNFSVAMPDAQRTRVTASAGLDYRFKKNERLGVNLVWQEQPIGKSVLTVFTGYTLGF
ncbi:autotransporter domain-containing protein [Hydrogenophaga sp.]|uniref:autotransporter outer membrane beta-barrel domain-containing protein n=1 Tax=Hydrogenophaga sp. TaxID=1904254 RepID=UPI0025BDE049|nr:autotransporter domain-containing protein [Hydrogenophaga sp.]MBT9464089.1 autotransporter domain-containing protein [Hydrogenophaga sp.]